MTIEEIKENLPEVRVKIDGKIYRTRVAGRLNDYADILGCSYSWEAVQRVVNGEFEYLMYDPPVYYLQEENEDSLRAVRLVIVPENGKKRRK